MKQKIELNLEQTSSHLVDPQKGFTPLCPDELPVPDGHNIVEECVGQNNLVNIKTISKDVHPPNAIWIATEDVPQLSKIEKENVDLAWNSHCISGTYGCELLDGLGEVKDYDFFAAKGIEPDMHPYTGCYHDQNGKISTGLIEFLKSKKIKNIIVGGLALEYCVKETVIDLVKSDFNVILNIGAIRGLGDKKTQELCLKELKEDYNVTIINSYKEILIK